MAVFNKDTLTQVSGFDNPIIAGELVYNQQTYWNLAFTTAGVPPQNPKTPSNMKNIKLTYIQRSSLRGSKALLIVSCLELIPEAATTSCARDFILNLLCLLVNLNLSYSSLNIRVILNGDKFILLEIEAVDYSGKFEISITQSLEWLSMKFDLNDILIENVDIWDLLSGH